ncbi:MAG: ubiquitin carboxyl-terminal hydrolase [Amphiamblys sp. WSBS2006]|nr:MAG: ubiquitin carboxyl-terminal hydrolase [Amphiamblys sp. WSBS2006]
MHPASKDEIGGCPCCFQEVTPPPDILARVLSVISIAEIAFGSPWVSGALGCFVLSPRQPLQMTALWILFLFAVRSEKEKHVCRELDELAIQEQHPDTITGNQDPVTPRTRGEEEGTRRQHAGENSPGEYVPAAQEWFSWSVYDENGVLPITQLQSKKISFEYKGNTWKCYFFNMSQKDRPCLYFGGMKEEGRMKMNVVTRDNKGRKLSYAAKEVEKRKHVLFRVDLCTESYFCRNKAAFKDVASIEIEFLEAIPSTGIENTGLTCYMNSLLQMLFFIPSFRNIVGSIAESGKDQLICALDNVFFCLEEKNTTVNPISLFQLLIQEKITGFGMQDPQEVFVHLLGYILGRAKGTENEEKIKTLFSIEQKNEIICTNVDYRSSTTEFFYNMPLVMKHKKNIEESLDFYMEKELFSGENAYAAEGHGKQDANRSISFKKLPPTLVFMLQRYWCNDFGEIEKVKDWYEFPEILSMGKYLSSDTAHSEPQDYVLSSIVSHTGSMRGGHYVSYVRDMKKNKWMLFDDELAIYTSSAGVLEENYGCRPGYPGRCGYMLTYVRLSDVGSVFCDKVSRKDLERILEEISASLNKEETEHAGPESRESTSSEERRINDSTSLTAVRLVKLFDTHNPVQTSTSSEGK